MDSLATVCQKLGIKAFFLDLDDNLIHTNPVFKKKIGDFCRAVVSRHPHLDYEVFLQTVNANNNALFEIFGVSPQSWFENCKLLVRSIPEIRSTVDDAKVHLSSIYTTKLSWKKGSRTLLRTIMCSQIPIFVVTHANEDWTQFKVETLKISRYINGLYVVPEREQKDSYHWQEALDKFGYGANDVLVMGDSLKTDIIPTSEIGVRKLVWMDDPDSWHKYRSGNIPNNTAIVKAPLELLDVLITNKWPSV